MGAGVSLAGLQPVVRPPSYLWGQSSTSFQVDHVSRARLLEQTAPHDPMTACVPFMPIQKAAQPGRASLTP